MLEKKQIIAIIAVLPFLVVPAGYVGWEYATAEHLTLAKDVVQIEYGNKKAEIKKEDFIGDNMSKEAIAQVKMSSPFGKDDSAQLTPGKYEVIFKYTPAMHSEEIERGYVIIADTNAPKFIDPPEELYIEQNARDVKIENYFKIEDLTKVSVEIQNKYSLQVPNVYAINVIAKDTTGNETSLAVKLTVVATEDVLNGTSHLTAYVNGDTPVSDMTAKALIEGTLADINTPKRQRDKEDSKSESDTAESKTEEKTDQNQNQSQNQSQNQNKNQDKKETDNKKKDTQELKNKTEEANKNNKDPNVYYTEDPCDLSVPPEGIRDKQKAIEQAQSYVKMVGLDETHTYSLIEHDTSDCGKYYTYSIILRD